MSRLGKKPWGRRVPTLSERLCRHLDAWQRRLADRLNERFAQVSMARLRFGLVLGCVLVAAYLCWLIGNAFG